MCTIQRKLKRVLRTPPDERKECLEKLANDLGVSLRSGDQYTGKPSEEELVRRIQEAARSKRESSLWIIAIISGVASVISALAAWVAILNERIQR